MEAVPEPARREDREREHDERGDCREDAECAQGTSSAGDGPDVDHGERDDRERVELRRHREPEQAEAEQLATAHEGGQRSDRERRRKEVVGVQRDRPDRDRREREQGGGAVEALPGRAQRHEHEQDREQRADPAQGHERLEGRVVCAGGQNRRGQEHRERARWVLDEDVPVRNLAAEEAVGVDAVDVDVPVAIGAEQAAVRDRAGEQEERRGERRDARGQPRARRRRLWLRGWRRRRWRRRRRRRRAAGGGSGRAAAAGRPAARSSTSSAAAGLRSCPGVNGCQIGSESAVGNSRTGVGPIASSMNSFQIVAGNVPPATAMPCTFSIGISACG